MSELKLALLGAPQAMVGEKSIVVESRKALALLFYLAVTQRRHSRDRLATMLWPEQDQGRARASLRQVLWLLRNAGLEPWLVLDQDALALEAGYRCDVHLFQAEIGAGHLTKALTLYRDHFLAGFSLRDCPEFDQWQFMQADEYRRQLASLLEEWVVRCSEAGEYERGLEYARRWLALDTLHEPAHRHLMQLYAYAGQQAAAQRQYEECVRILEEELGVSPDEATVALYNRIKSRQLSPPSRVSVSQATPFQAAASQATVSPVSTVTRPYAPGTGTSLPAAGSTAVATPVTSSSLPSAPFHNLPTQLSPFVGRERDIEDLQRILGDVECRLVTIVGPGGIGKTRLSVQIARRFVDRRMTTPPFAHGVLFVALSAVDSISGVIASIAEVCGQIFYANESPRQQLLDYLRDKEMLLLLDNFEHLLAAVDLVAEILAVAPGITILVTSREPLNLQGEWQWKVGGLPFPEGDIRNLETELENEAAYEEESAEYSAVRLFVQNARRVQTRFSLSAEYEHVVRICQLVGGMPLAIELAAAWLKVVPPAQIVREIERDLNFLTTRLRDVPDRHRSIQAVFEHSWRLLTPTEQETFKRLSLFRGGFHRRAAEQVAGASWIDLAALVEKSLVSVAPSGRYQIHELLRQYGARKLEADQADKQAALDRHGRYFADFMHERFHIVNGRGQREAGAEIAADLDNVRAAWQWAVQGRRSDDIYRIAGSFYFFCQLHSRFLEGADLLQEGTLCLDSLQPSTERDLALAEILNHHGWLLIRLGEIDKAAAVLQRSRDLYAQHNVAPRSFMGGDSTVSLAIVCLIQGDYERAVELSTESLHLCAARDDKYNLAFANYALAAGKLALGEYEAAHEHAQQACSLARELQTRWFEAYALNRLGTVARAMGNDAEAERFFQESYTIREEFGDPEGMAVALNFLGEIASLHSDYEKAERLYQQALALYQKINDRGGLATSRKGLGQVACARRDYASARTHFAQALTIAMEIHFWPLVFALLLDVGTLLMQTGAASLAIELLTLVEHQPASEQEIKDRARQHLQAWQERVAPDFYAQAVERGTHGTLQAVVPHIFAEFSTPSRPGEVMA